MLIWGRVCAQSVLSVRGSIYLLWAAKLVLFMSLDPLGFGFGILVFWNGGLERFFWWSTSSCSEAVEWHSCFTVLVSGIYYITIQPNKDMYFIP